MKLVICAIYDKKAKEYQAPFIMPNEATAIRNFMQAVKDEKNMLNQFAEDYRLDKIGEFDTIKGYIHNNEENKPLLEAANVVVKTEKK